MLTNLFLSALITLFFLGNSSKEIEEKTDHASWPRTLVYLMLFLISGIFFLRTFQVSTIINNVTLTSLRGSEDSLHHSTDTIENVRLINNFKALGSYRNPYIEYLENNEDYIFSGGLSIRLKHPEYSSILHDRSGLTAERKNEIESLTGVQINSNTGSIYQLELNSNTILSFIPLLPNIRVDIPKVEKGETYSAILYAGTTRVPGNGKIGYGQSDLEAGNLANGISAQKTIISHESNISFKDLGIPLPLVNSMNIFTAADLSQYTYCIELHSDMYVKNLSVAYNIPIEIVNQSEGVIVSANGFDLTDSDLLNSFITEEQPMLFLVKMPTMANLQQIRSLILTAIVSIFLSLFFTNLFYWLRKIVRDFIKKKNIDITEEHLITKYRVNDVKFIFYALSFILLGLIFIAAFMAAFDYVFFVDYERDVLKILGRGLLIIVGIPACLYFFFSRKRKKGSHKEKKVSKVK